VGLVARAIEAEGIPTVIAMMYRQVADALRPPRVAYARFPFGQPLGEPGNADQQRVVIEDSLRLLVTATEPGVIEALPYRWRRENYAAIRMRRGNVLAPSPAPWQATTEWGSPRRPSSP
jgi:D-proline reductase (dithiol) PrdB